MKKINIKKPKILLGTPIAFFSLEAYLGMIFGYFAGDFFSPKIKSITFNIGNYKFHLHHWLLCLGIFPLILIYKFSPLPIYFSSGFLGGLILQGIFSYPDWHRILIKKNG
jgi:hypothetical protein